MPTPRPEPPFLGRQRDLQALQDGLSLPFAKGSSCVQVTGPEGAGKTRLVAELLQDLRRRQRSAIVISLARDSLADPEADLRALALASTRALKPDLQRLADSLRAAADADTSNGLDLSAEMIERYRQRASSGWSPLTRCIFVLEDLATWPEFKLREWRTFVRTLGADESNLRDSLDFIATGRDPDELATIWGEYGLPEARVNRLALGPLTAPEVSDLLAALGVPATRADVLRDQAEGWPGRLVALADEALQANEHADRQNFARELYARSEARTHPFWYALGALNQLGRDLCEALLRRDIPGEEWKLFLQQIRETQAMPGFPGWTPDFRQQLCRHAEQVLRLPRWPENLVRELNELAEVMPDEGLRRLLVHFSPFFYFAPALLKDVYGPAAAPLEAFLVAHPEAFLEVEGQFQLAPQLQRPTLAYAEMTGFDRDGRIRAQVQQLWKARQDALNKEAQEQDQAYEELNGRLDQCNRELERHANELRKLLEQEQRVQQQTLVSRPAPQKSNSRMHRTLGGIAAEVLGIFFLYNGIIFTAEFNATYCLIGLVLVMAGIMGNLTGPVTVTAPRAANPAPPVEPMPSHVMRLREYQVKTLVERRKALQQRLQKAKRSREEIDRRLEQAYVY